MVLRHFKGMGCIWKKMWRLYSGPRASVATLCLHFLRSILFIDQLKKLEKIQKGACQQVERGRSWSVNLYWLGDTVKWCAASLSSSLALWDFTQGLTHLRVICPELILHSSVFWHACKGYILITSALPSLCGFRFAQFIFQSKAVSFLYKTNRACDLVYEPTNQYVELKVLNLFNWMKIVSS